MPVASTYDEKVLSFAIDGPIAYLYTYDYQSKDSAIKVFDLNAGTVIRDNFITDGTAIQTPFSIQLNLSAGIYISRKLTIIQSKEMSFASTNKGNFNIG